MTAVTTAGLLAGLFGSAFVPAARAAAVTAGAVTSSNKDAADAAAKTLYFSTAVFPIVEVKFTADHATDDQGAYQISVSGGTIRSCVLGGTGAAETALITTSTTCAGTTNMDIDAAPETFTITMTLNALSAGSSVTLSGNNPDAAAVTLDYTTLTGTASASLANKVNAAKSAAAVAWNSDGDANADEATEDAADTTISSVKYYAPTQPAKKAIVTGILKNGYGTAMAVATNLVAEVSGAYTVGCESDATFDGTFTDSGAALQSFTVANNVDGKWECQVFSDSKTAGNTDGGAWTLTVKTDQGLLVGTASGGFLGKVTKLEISAPFGTIIATAAADVAAAVKVVATDAAGRAWPRARVAAITGWDADATIKGVVTDLAVDAVASKATVNTLGAYATLDNSVMCPALAEDTTVTDYTINIPSYIGATTTVVSNALSFTCGADAASDLYISKFVFSKSDPNPGEVIQLHTYMEDAFGSPAGLGDVPGAAVVMTLSGATDLAAIDKFGDELDVAADLDAGEAVALRGSALDGGNADAADSQIQGGGYFAMTVKASTTVGTVVQILEPSTSLITKAFVVSDAFVNTIVAGPKKLKATANFGPAAARRKIAFVLESSSGTTKTFYRRADASGVASYTLVPRGTWTVYATYGDEISETVTLRK